VTRHYRTTAFADVSPEAVRWLWPGRIPLGKVTLMEGDGGIGKSTFTSWICARVSAGDLGGDLREPANVLLMSAEDSASDTIRPGLERQGAALARVHGLHHDDASAFALPEGGERLHRTIVRTNTKLVVIDPIASFLGQKVSITSDTSVRRALGPLKEIAEDAGAAIVLVRHLNGQRKAPAYRRGLGGAALANIARSVLVMALHPDDGGDPRGRRVVAMVKSNLCGRSTSSVEFQLDDTGRLIIGSETDITADQLLASQPQAEARGGRLEEAIAFLRHELDGHEVGVADLEAMARGIGISERTLNRARDQLGLRPRRAAGRWWLSLEWTTANTPDEPSEPPEQPPTDPRARVRDSGPSSTTATPEHVATAIAERSRPQVAADDASLRFALLELDDPKGSNPPGTLATSPDSNQLAPRVPRPNGASPAA
jgi:hypothetical protein